MWAKNFCCRGRYLQNDGGAWFELLNAGWTDCLKHGVGIVQEVVVAERAHGLHAVQDETELVGPLHHLLLPTEADGQRWGLAQHGGGVQHFARLWKGRTHRNTVMAKQKTPLFLSTNANGALSVRLNLNNVITQVRLQVYKGKTTLHMHQHANDRLYAIINNP